MGWGFLEKIVDKVHDATKWIDPIGHYSLDAAHDSSTKLVNETSRAIENLFGKDTLVGGWGEHWKNMSQKDKEDFGRWATNTGLSAAAVYGGISAAGQGGAAGAGAGAAGEAGAAGAAGGAGSAAGAAGSAGGYLEAGGAFVPNSLGAAGSAGLGGGAAAGAAGSGGYGALGAQALNGLMQAYQSKKASDALVAGGDAANATQRYMFDLLNAQQQPYRETGYNALGHINGLMNDPSSVVNDPGYQFGLKEGMRGIDNSASARGGIGGAALKAGTRYAQDYAGTKLNDAYNRYLAPAGLGQVANGQTSSVGMNSANQISGIQQGQANALAGNALNQGNIWGSAINGLAAYGSQNNWWGG
jgi:hypothetical protein